MRNLEAEAPCLEPPGLPAGSAPAVLVFLEAHVPASVSHTFYVPRRFDPAASLMGRWLRRVVGDAQRAEALFLVTLSMAVLGLVLAQYLAWVLLKPAIVAAPGGSVAVAFWLFQVSGLVVAVLTCVLGFQPAITVVCTPAALHLGQKPRLLTLRYDEIDSVASIPARQFHRHYARYAATQRFVNRVGREVLLLGTAHGPVALGLAPDDHATLHRLLETRLAAARPIPTAQVA